ncbi:MAG: extensin family protein [bacterium]
MMPKETRKAVPSHGARRLLAGLLIGLAALVGLRAARAVSGQEWRSWGVLEASDADFAFGFSEPLLAARATANPPGEIDQVEWKIPLVTRQDVTGTPAPVGSDLGCLTLLDAEGVSYKQAKSTEGVATPVQVEDTIGGVRYRYYFRGQAPRVLDCRLALALVRAAPVLRANGVTEVVYANHYRPSFGTLKRGEYHFHAQGLAIDIKGFVVGTGTTISVERDYEAGLGFQGQTCLGRPMTVKGLLLRKIVCDLDEADVFEAMLTPDFDSVHWNHFHFSAYHARQRSKLRPRGTVLLEVHMADLTPWAVQRPTRQRPELRRWDVVAARPWPEEHRWIRTKLGIANQETDAELAAQLSPGLGMLGELWNAVTAPLDKLPPDVEDLMQLAAQRAAELTAEPTLSWQSPSE